MNCEDLMNMESIRKGMKLIAGDKGIDRTIRWIYFADCVQCLSADFNVAELIHGEELVIITNESLTENDSRLIDMIRVMQEKNIAALAVNEGQISKGLASYCNEVELPLFELSVSLHLIDLSQIVCKALVEEESFTNSRESILSTILYSDNLNVEELLEQANYLGINLSGKYRCFLLQLHQREKLPNDTSRLDEGYMMECGEVSRKWLKRNSVPTGWNG